MRHKKQIKTGGGYDSDMAIDSDKAITLGTLSDMTEDDAPDYDYGNMKFVVTNKITKDMEAAVYSYVKYVGQGTYGIVYLVNGRPLSDSDGQQKQFVIKIQRKYPSIQEEALKMDTIMSGINPECAYAAVSQGTTSNIQHAVFPYVGSKNLLEYVEDVENAPNIALFPKIIADVIRCLTAINSKGFSHLDIKLENVVINEFGKSTIIDYGLAVPHSAITKDNIGDNSVVNAGDPQLSVEMLLGRSETPDPNFDKDDTIITKIKQTIDNFGLFWLILDILTLGRSYAGVFVHFTTMEPTLPILLRFYNELITIKFQNTVIAKVNKLISLENFNTWFKGDQKLRFDAFMKRVFLLVHYDPNHRIYANELLSDPFFSGVLSEHLGSGGGYSYKRPPRKRTRTRRSRLGRGRGRGRGRKRTVSGLKK